MSTELQQIADEAARLFDAAVTMEDRDFNLIAHGAQRADIDPVREASILSRRSTSEVRAWFEQFGIATSDEPLRTPADDVNGVRSRLCVPARWRGVTYGYIWVLDETRALEDPVVVRAVALAEHAAVCLARQSRQRRSEAAVVDDLLAADRESSSAAADRLRDSGFLARGDAVVAVVAGVWRGGAPREVAIDPWQPPGPVLRSASGGQTVLLVPVRRGDDLGSAREIAALLLARYAQLLAAESRQASAAGIGAPRTDLLDARASWQEARVAARVAATVPDAGPIAEWDALGVYRLLAADTRVDLAALVIDDAVRRLIEHPDTELRHTVQVYFDHAGNAQLAARALHIHRQTLYYRIAKAEQVTGIDLRTGHGRLRLQLALTMAPLLEH